MPLKPFSKSLKLIATIDVLFSSTSRNSIINAPIETIKIQENEPLEIELKEFIDCVYSRKDPLTDHNEALKVQTVMDMIDKKI